VANFTARAIKASFIKLLNERPLSKISVRDIVEDCGINRNSFYYHFQDIPALIEEIITEQTETIIREHPTIDTLEECFSAACSRTMENKRAIYHIYHSVKRDLFEKELFRICEYAVNTYVNTAFREEQMPESDRKILARFIKCELFGLIIEWLEEGMQQDAVSDLLRITELCRGMAAQLIRRSVEEGA